MSKFKSKFDRTAEQMIERAETFDIYSACGSREDAENCVSCQMKRIRLRLLGLIAESALLAKHALKRG